MRDQERLACLVVVSPPTEIDIANAKHAGEELLAAFAPGVITEIGLTVFCCAFGRRMAAAHKGTTNWLTNSGSAVPLPSQPPFCAVVGR